MPELESSAFLPSGLLFSAWQGNPRKHATWLASRPRRFEQNAVRALLGALRATSGNATLPGFKLHIVHLSGELAMEERERGRSHLMIAMSTSPASAPVVA